MSISANELQKWRESARHKELVHELEKAVGAIPGPFPAQRRVSGDKSHENRTQTQIPDPEPEQQPAALASQGGGETPGTGRPHVRFTLRRVRLLDVDSKYGSCKDLLDGLQISKLIPGDREDQITLEVRQEKVKSFKDEETIITVEIQ